MGGLLRLVQREGAWGNIFGGGYRLPYTQAISIERMYECMNKSSRPEIDRFMFLTVLYGAQYVAYPTRYFRSRHVRELRAYITVCELRVNEQLSL